MDQASLAAELADQVDLPAHGGVRNIDMAHNGLRETRSTYLLLVVDTIASDNQLR